VFFATVRYIFLIKLALFINLSKLGQTGIKPTEGSHSASSLVTARCLLDVIIVDSKCMPVFTEIYFLT
jgi:hypothetical protein